MSAKFGLRGYSPVQDAAPGQAMSDSPDHRSGFAATVAEVVLAEALDERLREAALRSDIFDMPLSEYQTLADAKRLFSEAPGMDMGVALGLAALIDGYISRHAAAPPLELGSLSVADLVAGSELASEDLIDAASRSPLLQRSAEELLHAPEHLLPLAEASDLDPDTFVELVELARRAGTQGRGPSVSEEAVWHLLDRASLSDLTDSCRVACPPGLLRAADEEKLLRMSSVGQLLSGQIPRRRFLFLPGYGVGEHLQLLRLAWRYEDELRRGYDRLGLAAQYGLDDVFPQSADPSEDPHRTVEPQSPAAAVAGEPSRHTVSSPELPAAARLDEEAPPPGDERPRQTVQYALDRPSERPAAPAEDPDAPAAREQPSGFSDTRGPVQPAASPQGILAATSLDEIVHRRGGSVRLRNCAARTPLFRRSAAEFLRGQQEADFLKLPNLGQTSFRELRTLVRAYAEDVQNGSDPLQIGLRLAGLPTDGGAAAGAPSLLKETTLAALVRGSAASTRLTNLSHIEPFFSATTVADLLHGKVTDADLQAVTGLGPALAGELRQLAETWVTELADRAAAADGAGQLPRGRPLPGMVPETLGRLTLRDLADHSGFPVRIANRLPLDARLAGLTVGELLADRAAAAASLRQVPNLGRRSVAELFGLIESLMPPEADRKAGDPGQPPAAPVLPPREAVAAALEALPERSRYVIERRYGLAGHHPHTLEAVARLVYVTRERVRQVEKKGLQQLSKRPWREAFARLLESERDAAWNTLTGGQRFLASESLSDAAAGLDPVILLSADLVHGGLPAWLATFSKEVPGGWIEPGGTLGDVHAAAQQLRESLENLALPRPLADLAERAGLSAADAEIALTQQPGLRLRDGWVHRGTVGPKARRAVRLHGLASQAATGGVMDVWRLAKLDESAGHEDERSPRMIQIQLGEAPHLFAQLFDQYWVVLTGEAGRSGSPAGLPPAETGAAEVHFQPDSASEWMRAVLEADGPMSHVDLRDRACVERPDVRAASVGPMLLGHPVFHRIGAGVFDVRRPAPRVAGEVPPAMLTENQCRTYARAVHSGEPRTYFSGWGLDFEWRACEWARTSAEADVYRSLLAIADPAAWPAPESVRHDWLRRRSIHGAWRLSAERRTSLGALAVSPDQFLAGMLHLALLGTIGWISAARVCQERLGGHGPADLLALLSAAGVADAPDHWQLAHRAGPELHRTLSFALAERWATGSLDWGSGVLADVAGRVRTGFDRVRWAAPAEADGLIASVGRAPRGRWGRGRVHAPALENVEDLFASSEWEELFSNDQSDG